MVLILMVLWLFTQGDATNVRLSGGRGPWEGRLEINHNGSWETVCYREFRLNDAKVVCHMLGYQRVIALFNRKRLSSGNSGRIMLNNIRCTGNENDIGTCPSSEWFKTNCDYHSDVGLSCVRHGLEPVEGVRLVGGTGPYEGTVELNINGVWGTICSNAFDLRDANVICRMAGYPRAVQAFIGAHFGKADGSVLLDYLHCTGNETNIDNCNSDGWYRTNCYHSQDAGVACLSSKRSHTVEGIRLAGGMGPFEGTVQLNINGVWGSICGNSFDINDAHVICKMVGYPRAVQAFRGAHFGKANGSVMIDYLHCTGNETNIENCNSDGWYKTNCYHSQDAGVACLGNGPAIG